MTTQPEADVLKTMTPEQKKWLANAMSGMICADGVIDEDELQFLSKAIDFLTNPQDINNMVKMVKAKKLPELTKLDGTDKVLAFRMLKMVAEIALTDSVKECEEKYLLLIGEKLSLDKKFVDDFVTWTRQYVALNRLEQDLLKRAGTK